MILGIDTGLATCGWALLDERRCELVDLGVVLTKKHGAEAVTIDRARRALTQAQVIAEKAVGVKTIVVERMSFPRNMGAAVSIALSWGVALGLVSMLDPRPRLLAIAPQKWQREILPDTKGRVDYERLERAAAAHVRRRHPRVRTALWRIPERHRNHALDAAMIALVAGLRPTHCDVIVDRAGGPGRRTIEHVALEVCRAPGDDATPRHAGEIAYDGGRLTPACVTALEATVRALGAVDEPDVRAGALLIRRRLLGIS